MSQYFFGSGSGRLNGVVRRVAESCARRHGAELTEHQGPGDEQPRYWFSCFNRGNPFDQATAEAVEQALASRGLDIHRLNHGWQREEGGGR